MSIKRGGVMNIFYKSFGVIFLFISAIGLAPFSHAEEYNLSYGARLTKANGAPIPGQDGKLDLEVSFYNAGSGGSLIGPSPISFPETSIAEGVFQLSITLTPTEFHQVFQDPSTPVYIEVKDVKSGAVFPRQRFSVIPFALKTPIDNDTIVYNSDGKLTVGSTVGTVKQVTAGSGLTGGVITDSGTITVDTGTTGNKIVQLSDGKLPSVDGSNLSSVNAEKLQTRNVSAAVPVSGQVLKWSGSAWVPSSDLVGETGSGEANTASNVTSGSGVGIFKGKVSADLLFYSLSPGAGVTISLVGDDVVVASTITQYTDAMAKAAAVADAITDAITDKAPSQNAVFDALALKSATSHNHSGVYEPAGLSTDVVTTTKILNGAVTAAKIAACSDTQILKMSGPTNWVCSSDANSGGTVTSVGSGTGLTGGPITNTGTLSLATSGVTTGTYTKVTVDTYGRATSGTTLGANDLPSNIDAAKIGSGAVSDTEFGYLDGVTSTLQTQLTEKVVGPASATDNAIARFDGTTGKLIQNSSVVLDDSGNVGIGTTSPAEKLDVNGKTKTTNLQVTSNAASGRFLVSDATGNAAWTDQVIRTAVTLNVPASYADIQAALDYLNDKTFAAGSSATIQVADGTYNYTTFIYVHHPQGEHIKIIGNETTPANVVLQFPQNVHGFWIGNSKGIYKINGFTIKGAGKSVGSGGTGFYVNLGGSVEKLGPNIVIKDFRSHAVRVEQNSVLHADGITVQNCGDGFYATYSGTIFADSAMVTNTTYAFNASSVSSIYANNAIIQNSGIALLSQQHSVISSRNSIISGSSTYDLFAGYGGWLDVVGSNGSTSNITLNTLSADGAYIAK